MKEEKAKILNRLRRIEGQVKGIQKMLDTDQCCTDILVQIAAVRAAINGVGGLLFERFAKECLAGAATPEAQQQALADLLKTMNSFMKGGGGQDGSDR